MDKRHWEHGPCPKHDCRKDSCKCGLRLISFPAALGDDSKGSPVAPKNGDYCNALVKYESNGHMYVYSTEGVPERLSSNGTLNFEELLNRPQYNGEAMTGETNIPEVPSAVSQLTNDLKFQTEGEVDSKVASAVAGEAATRQNADNNLQSQIDGISASSDVKDIVGTYAELQAYDTSTLGDNDIIKVLQDEMHSDETTYYRWSTTTQTFTLIGEEGPYYTKSATDQLLATKADKTTTYTKTETDNLLSGKQGTLTAGENIAIDNDTISADVGTTFYVSGSELHSLPLNVGTPISIYKDKTLTTLVTRIEMYEALYSDKMVKIATSDRSLEDTLQTYLVTASDDDFYDGSVIGFNIITSVWDRKGYYNRVEFTWESGATEPNAVERVNRCVRVEEVQGGTYDVNNSSSGIYELRNTGSTDTLLLPKGIDGDPNFQLKIKPGHSVYIMEMVQTNAGGRKYLVFGATNGSDVEVALVEPNATAKLKLWAQYTNNLTTTNSDGQKVLSAYQGKVLADRIGDLSTLQTTAKTSTVDAINEIVSGKQDTLTAGSNISISGNTISATDTTYTAGNGLDLTGTAFSVDTDVVATQSDVANVTSYITDATEYSASATYEVGDYTIHDGTIYQCNIAIVGGEAWDASHWDAVPSLQGQLDNTETWTFKLEGGTTVTKKVVVR